MTDKISEQDLALLNHGFKLSSEGKSEDALAAFEIAAQTNALCAPVAYTVRGTIYQELRQFDNAEREFRRALELVPFSRKASYFLHGLFYEMAKYEEAIAEGVRFFEGRKSRKNDRVIQDYRISLENLLGMTKGEFIDSHSRVFGDVQITDTPD